MYPEDTTHKEENFLVEIIRFTIIALLIVIPIRIFVAQPFIVQGASMEPTFETGQYLIVDQLSYRLEAPARGDVIVFRYPKDPKKFFIKRIIGLPGETITIDRTTVSVTNSQNPNGFVLDEPYIDSMNPDTLLTQELGENEYFVMGDNRDASSDSRVWGTLNEDLIIGRALIRLLPVSTMEILPGELEQPLSTDAK